MKLIKNKHIYILGTSEQMSDANFIEIYSALKTAEESWIQDLRAQLLELSDYQTPSYGNEMGK